MSHAQLTSRIAFVVCFFFVISANSVRFIAKLTNCTCYPTKILYAMGNNKKYVIYVFDQTGNAMRRGIHLTWCVHFSARTSGRPGACSNIQYAALKSPLLAIFFHFLARYMRIAGKVANIHLLPNKNLLVKIFCIIRSKYIKCNNKIYFYTNFWLISRLEVTQPLDPASCLAW